MANPTLAIVGRPNVGKSTLFNRIAGERISIVEDIPGVTRDRIYAHGEWLGREFSIIDTGGIEMSDEPFMDQIKHQAEIAIEEADVIVLVVSGREGITDADEYVSRILYKSNKPVILAVNKVDNPEMRNDIYEFYNLGLGEPFGVSSVGGQGLGDFLDEVVKYFPPMEMTIMSNATLIVSKSLKKTVKSINIPTLIKKKGIKIAFPTNSTLFISDEVCGINLFKAKPAKKAPIIASIPASSANKAAR